MSEGDTALEATGRQFVDAFNRRHADDLIALCNPDVEFHPSVLVGGAGSTAATMGSSGGGAPAL